MTRYHDAAFTLDPNVEIPDDAALSAGHDEQNAQDVKEASDTFREDAKAAADAQAERDAEWAERDPKPTPSELEIERGLVPVPEDDESDPKA